MIKKLTNFIVVAAGLSLASSMALASSYKRVYEVTITNITKGQTFTPQLVASHNRAISLFTLGEPASSMLETLAESGNTLPLTDTLMGACRMVTDVQTIDGLLMPGKSATIDIVAQPGTNRLSIGAMLIPTNDTFVALNSGSLPRRGSKTFYLKAYDAGTEANDQLCINIPGPRCGGEPDSAPQASDEGFVHVSNGFHDLGSADDGGNEILSPFTYDWRNPVAKVVVRRVH
ncbi:MAG: spondin domain-containing protein [Pseudomonadales bacterium]